MKILHALGWYFPESLGGTEVYVRALAERQRAAGHEVEVAAPKPGAAKLECSDYESIPVIRYPTPAKPTREEAQGRRVARGSEQLRDYLESSRPDIFHLHTFTTGLGVFELEKAKSLGIATVATNHLGSVGYLCLRGTLMRWGDYACDGEVEAVKCAACVLQQRGLIKPLAWTVSAAGHAAARVGLRLPGKLGTGLGMGELIKENIARQTRTLDALDRFVVLSRAASDIAVKNGGTPAKLAVNYLGLSHRNYHRKPTPEERPTRAPITVGYLGRFAELKGVIDLARAIATLPTATPIRFELRGPSDGDEGAKVMRAIEELVEGDSRVRIEPPAPPARVPETIASYDVLCVPSVAFEGGPTVISEAHAVGTPVIGTRIGAMPELIRHGIDGVLVDPGDSHALARTFIEIAERPAETIDVWRRALPPARTMDDVAADYESLYHDITA